MATPGDPGGDRPAVGEPLPAAAEARIDGAKLSHYALDPAHPVGRHKARVFRRALGIERNDWEYLRDGILDQLPHRRVTGVRGAAPWQETSTWKFSCRYRVCENNLPGVCWSSLHGR